MEMCCISQEELGKIEGRFVPVKSLDSVDDVATLVEIFEIALMETTSSHIVDVVGDKDGNYLFVTSLEPVGTFDFYEFINSRYSGGVTVNCVNAKLMFPRGKSRGIFNGSFEVVEEDDEEEEATGFMDEDELEDIVTGDILRLVQVRTGGEIPITKEGTVLGRSSKQSEFVIHGNGNVSRKHCRVFRSGNSYFVHNYEPPNGTFIDGVKVPFNQERELTDGCTLMLADEEFRVV